VRVRCHARSPIADADFRSVFGVKACIVSLGAYYAPCYSLISAVHSHIADRLFIHRAEAEAIINRVSALGHVVHDRWQPRSITPREATHQPSNRRGVTPRVAQPRWVITAHVGQDQSHMQSRCQ
jgi:hypothetical protein